METANKKTLENILLVSLRSPYLDDSKIYPPLGLLYLKSAAEQQCPGVNIDLTDDYQLRDIDRFSQYDAIGLSIMTPQRKEAELFLKMMKLNLPHIPVIAGGPHVLYYKQESEQMPFDFLVIGEGERVFPKIIRGEANRTEYDLLPKIELDKMPRPDRTSDKARQLLYSFNYSLNERNSTTAFFARGCTEQCTFCEDAVTGVRWTSDQKIKQELDDIINLGYKGLYLFDDIFSIALPKTKPIAEEIGRRGLIYRCNAQARYFVKWGEEFAKVLANTGCYEIAFGAETGNQQILDNIKKRTTVEQNYKTVAYAKKHGLKVKAFLMIGLPGETLQTIADTVKFIETSGIDDFQLSIYYPYKGTAIRDAIDKGDSSNDLYFEGEGLGAYGQKGGSTESVVRTSALTSQQLLQIRDEIVKKYKPESHQKKWFHDTHILKGGY